MGSDNGTSNEHRFSDIRINVSFNPAKVLAG